VNVRLEENVQAIAKVDEEIRLVVRKLAALDADFAFEELWEALSDRARKRDKDAFYDALCPEKPSLEAVSRMSVAAINAQKWQVW